MGKCSAFFVEVACCLFMHVYCCVSGLWSVYGLFMVCLWSVYGLLMVCLWFVWVNVFALLFNSNDLYKLPDNFEFGMFETFVDYLHRVEMC